MRDRVAVVSGLRTPFAKAGTALASLRATELGAAVVKELLARVGVAPKDVGLCIYGQVVPSLDGINIAREVVLRSNLPASVDAYSVSRACATSIQALTDAVQWIEGGRYDTAIVGGADSSSHVPFGVSPRLRDAFVAAQKARSVYAKVRAFARVRPRDLVPQAPGFMREPTSGETMGEAAERMAEEHGIDRALQDRIALASHRKAHGAWSLGVYAKEVMPLHLPGIDVRVDRDNIVRPDASLESLARLPPVFDRTRGTVTAGNSSPLTDGASALLVMRESKAAALGYKVLGYVRAWEYAAVDPARGRLIAPAHAILRLLQREGMTLANLDLFDLHEAFAAQVASTLKVLASREFADKQVGPGMPIGEVDPDKLNVKGGSIALGHPFAATGARLVLSTLAELGRRGQQLGLVSICAAGGLGAAVLLESA